MTSRTAARLAWSLWGAALVFGGLFVWLVMLSFDSPGPLEYDELIVFDLVYLLLIVTYPSVGVVIASRVPSNAIGWMFCLTGILIGGGLSAQLYADYVLFNRPGYFPGGEVALWFSSWALPLGLMVTPIFLMFLFPTGKPGSTFWRRVVAVMAAVVAMCFIGTWFMPGRLEPTAMLVQNPFGVTGALADIARFLNSLVEGIAPIAFLLSVASLLARRRRASADERVQLRWFGYTATVMASSFAMAFVADAVVGRVAGDVFFAIGALALVCIPLASGVAILKYRLYDIDVIVNRTLVYGALTAILAATYLATVFVLQSILRPLTPESDLAIAASTLAVAALFRPVRARVQGFIDRRFYRRKFDVQQTLESFSSRARDQVDLASLSAELVGVVQETMAPAHVSLWLRRFDGGTREAAQ